MHKIEFPLDCRLIGRYVTSTHLKRLPRKEVSPIVRFLAPKIHPVPTRERYWINGARISKMQSRSFRVKRRFIQQLRARTTRWTCPTQTLQTLADDPPAPIPENRQTLRQLRSICDYFTV